MKSFNYDIKNLRGDLIGGVTTAIVALPLALAFGVASGAGAKAGLYSAVFTGILSTLFGGTPAQINGPTGAMTVVLINVYTLVGLEGLFAAMILAGLIQILLGVLKLGKYIHLIPHPVVIGFTNGIGILIFIKMLPYFKTSPLLGLIIIAIMFIFPLITKKVPASLIALIIGIVLGVFIFKDSTVIGKIPEGFPVLRLPNFEYADAFLIIKSAIMLALLGVIESLLASVIVDEMTKTKHNSNKELIGQGIGNTVAALFGSLIGTGAIVRSAVNVNAGGRTRLSGIIHGFVILAIIIWLGPFAANVPIAVLGAILMATAVKMIEYNTTKELSLASNKAGVIILVTTVFTVATDLVIAVVVGTLVAMVAFVLKTGQAYLKSYEVDDSKCAKKITSYTIEGPLYFGVSHTIASRIEIEAAEADIIILNLMNMPTIDSSGGIALRNINANLKEKGKELYFAGVKEPFYKVLKKLEVIEDEKLELGRKRILEVIEHVKANNSL